MTRTRLSAQAVVLRAKRHQLQARLDAIRKADRRKLAARIAEALAADPKAARRATSVTDTGELRRRLPGRRV